MNSKLRHSRFQILALLLAGLAIAVLISCAPGEFVSGTRSANYVVESGGPGTGGGKKWRDFREFAATVKTESLREDSVHDPNNAAIATLQEPSDALAAFPQDRRGGINWVKALQLGIINPRADLAGSLDMATLDLDILFKDTGKMPWVKFPHLVHTQWLACENCHPDIFIPKIGANNPSMDGILAGEHCGRCHDKVAFALWICERCHSVPHENSPPAWWGESGK